MLVARITDAFVDPTVGLLSDRTKTRFGKYPIRGCFGLRCLSWFSMCWLSIIRALKIKGHVAIVCYAVLYLADEPLFF